VTYCCIFLFVLILGIKIHKDWDRSFNGFIYYLNNEIFIEMYKKDLKECNSCCNA